MTGENMMPTKEQELAEALAERLFPLRDLAKGHADLNTRLSIVETEAKADRAANFVSISAIHANLANQDKKLDTLVTSARITEGVSKSNKQWLQAIAWGIGTIVVLAAAYIEVGHL